MSILYTHIDKHIDQCGQSHHPGSQKERLFLTFHDFREYAWKEENAKNEDDAEDKEENEVEDEDYYAEDA